MVSRHAQLRSNPFEKRLLLRTASLVPRLVDAVSDSAIGQQPFIPPRVPSFLRWFAFDAFGDDLCESVEPFGMTEGTQPVSAVNPLFRFAIYTSIPLERNCELLLFGNVL
jgi:hypothetical protein